MVNLTTRCPQRGKSNPAILTAAPFRGLPQPEAHCRSGLTTTVLITVLRNVLSCCVPLNHVRRGGSCYSPTTRILLKSACLNSLKLSASSPSARLSKYSS
ncbi:hypothetical protein FA806_17765 [Escherichia coli]|nr:hypothetical protein [Escherichia coli]